MILRHLMSYVPVPIQRPGENCNCTMSLPHAIIYSSRNAAGNILVTQVKCWIFYLNIS